MMTGKSVELQSTLTALRDHAVQIEQQARAERLAAERALRLARGTRDVRTEAAAAVTGVRAETTTGKIEQALRGPDAPMTLDYLARYIDEPAGRVQNAMKRLRSAGSVVNIGTNDRPQWFWRIGDEGPTPELFDAVERIIRVRPHTLQELQEATGARRNRISGVLVKLQVRGLPVVNRGTDQRALWSISKR